jgi:hypothetical protein
MTHTFEPVVYWKLRALCTETQRCAMLAQHAQESLLAANGKQVALLTELGLDPKTPNFTLNDEMFTLTIPEPNGAP